MNKFSDYTSPPPKGPYQLNDIAVVNNFWAKGAQTKASTRNIGKMGIVIGYKNVPGSYSKYLLQFDNGDVDSYMPMFLSGPFIDKQIAQTYVDNPGKIIDPQDIKTKSGKPLSSEWETLPKVEAKLKDLLVNTFYFTWFDPPTLIRDYSPVAGIVQVSQPSFTLAELEGHPLIRLTRSHNRTTRKLKASTYGSASARGYTLFLPDDEHWGGLGNPTQVNLEDLLGTNPKRSWVNADYIKAYQEFIKPIIDMRNLVKKLPELEGIF